MKSSNPISFRLDEAYSERLHKEAEKYDMSDGEYARRLVLDALEDTERSQIRAVLETLHGEVAGLRAELKQAEGTGTTAAEQARQETLALRRELGALRLDVATAVTALLVGAGRVELVDAQNWVKKNLAQ